MELSALNSRSAILSMIDEKFYAIGLVITCMSVMARCRVLKGIEGATLR